MAQPKVNLLLLPWVACNAPARWCGRLACACWPVWCRRCSCTTHCCGYTEEPRRITLLFLITSEIATFLGLLLSRWAKKTDYHPLALAMVASAYSYTILLDATAGISLIPEPVGAVVQIVAICWTIFAKASLGRSFGLLPANRGVVVRGAYRWVRHPIYAGYLFIHLGFLAVNFGLRNLVVLSLLYFIQIGRLLREESLLSGSMAYRSYTAGVRYHLLPGVF